MSFRLARALLAPIFSILALGFAASAQAGEEPYAAAIASGPNDGPVALSSADRLTYTTAFDALRRGDLELARSSARLANDRVLVGHVEFERLFHRSQTATNEELSAWLEE